MVDLLRRDYPLEAEEAYWRSVLRYCVEGCLQSVIDEYTHVLRDHLGISMEEHWLIGALLGRFPKAGCAPHTADTAITAIQVNIRFISSSPDLISTPLDSRVY